MAVYFTVNGSGRKSGAPFYLGFFLPPRVP